MNKIGTNITQTPPENRGTKAAVVTQLKGDSRSLSEAGTQNASATVALSSQAVDLSALESRIKNLPDIDAARVVELHNRIVAGDYQVDSNSIASKIMSFESTIDSA